jgi:V8-like Glu-specific endopeptidase
MFLGITQRKKCVENLDGIFSRINDCMENIWQYSTLIVVMSTLLLNSCRKNNPDSQVKVIWGQKDDISYPEAIMIKTIFNKAASSCGGTIVRDDLVLTAAHCIGISGNGARPETFRVVTKSETFETQRLIISPNYPRFDAKIRAGKLSLHDLGFLIFNKGTFSREKNYSIGKIAQKVPKLNDKVSFIGYGLTAVNDIYSNPKNVRYRGDNEILHIYDDAVANDIVIGVVSYDNKKSCTNSGDSGGALFNTDGEIIGVTRAGKRPQVNVGNQWISEEEPSFSFFNNLSNPLNKKFIDDVMKKKISDLPIEQLGSATLR